MILKEALQMRSEPESQNLSCILDEYEKVILVYQQNDPYLVQIALSAISLIGSLS